jgi:1-acyl-sn-glycerol-3-phosphate acyltransferase
VLAKLDHAWRWFGTALSFLVFGIGGLITTLLIVPMLYCLPGDESTRTRSARRFIHHLFRLCLQTMRLLGVLSYQLEGVDKLRDANLILSNHPSLLDVVFLISMVPNANCVVKGKLKRNFFTRGAVKAAGYIMNEEAGDVIDAAKRVIEDGQTLIIFPEGTRTTPSEGIRFKRGAANVAIRTGSDITPVLIYCTPPTLTSSGHWYQVPDRRVHFRILVQDPLEIDLYLKNTAPSRGSRKLNVDLVDHFSRELEAHE